MQFTDAHCHLANLAQKYDAVAFIREAEQKGIQSFISNALSRKEIAWHQAHPIPSVKWHAGIHPSFDECDLDLEDMRNLLSAKEICAVGEIGLDRNNPELDWQRKIFLAQLQLAQEYSLPVVLHIVGHSQEAFELMREYPLKYLVHGYAGSLEAFRNFCRLDCCFTISSRLLKSDKQELLQEMLSYGRILFETDMTQYYVRDEKSNPLLELLDLVKQVSELSNITVNSLQEMQATTLQHFMPSFG